MLAEGKQRLRQSQLEGEVEERRDCHLISTNYPSLLLTIHHQHIVCVAWLSSEDVHAS